MKLGTKFKLLKITAGQILIYCYQ